MMKTRHLPNREIILTDDSDSFGHIDKGNAIISFFKSNINDLTDSNMFALYGNWGSGKSTLMKYIGKELENNDYKSLYFPAWEFEKDENLPLSLVHFISENSGISLTNELIKFKETAWHIFKSLTKSISIESGMLLELTTGVSAKLDPAKAFENFETYDKERIKKAESKFTKTKEFKENFEKIETEILKNAKKKKLIIFIDDLDRCEPENVLELISSIKLFFTYSKDVIFFFGCDKEAISKAVQHKYGDIIKADEYLEKVIDVSFNMPQDISIHKFLLHYFPEGTIYYGIQGSHSIFIEKFFKSINFTNPRHLKKVLNKFEIIRNFKLQGSLPNAQKHLIPNIIIGGDGDLLETIFVLFFIILYEFYPKEFKVLSDYNRKQTNYAIAYLNDHNRINKNNPQSFSVVLNIIQNNLGLDSFSISLQKIALKGNPDINPQTKQNSPNISPYAYNHVLAYFTPSEIEYLSFATGGSSFLKQFYHVNNSEGDIVLILFCEYLIKQKDWVLKMNSEYTFESFIKMCNILL